MTRYGVIVHSNDSPTQHSFDTGGVGTLEDFQIGDTVVPVNSYDGAEGMHVEFFKLLYLSVVKHPSFTLK